MKLTNKQEWLVARYLRAVIQGMEEAPESARDQALAHLKGRIAKTFSSMPGDSLNDPDVVAALDAIGSPSEVAREYLQRRRTDPGIASDGADRVWLGVCAGWAARSGTSTRRVRLLAVLLGLCTGPLALLAYLAAYLEMYFSARADSEESGGARISWWRAAGYTLGTGGGAIAIHVGARLVFRLIEAVYGRLMPGAPFPNLGEWDWFVRDGGSLLFLALVIAVPVAALSAMPLANRWDRTGKLIFEAILALYAMAVCLGIASRLVGLTRVLVETLT